jgi:predicted aconitase
VGERVGAGVPLLLGLPGDATETQLRSLCAAVGTVSDCALLHVAGHTPEAEAAQRHARDAGLCAGATRVLAGDLLALHARLTGVEGAAVRTVAVGAPHASADQVRELRAAMDARTPRVQVLLSLGREVAADVAADLAALQEAGVRVVRDSCTYYGSFVGAQGGPVVTPSVKWALYARANLGIDAWFGNALECQRALEAGCFVPDRAFWHG